MNKRKFYAFEKTAITRFFLLTALALSFAIAANAQTAKQKKWTYDFSEVVKFFDTPLAACQSYVKEKYPNENYKASVEATNDPEMYRCSAGDTYFGVVYKRECKSCFTKQIADDRPICKRETIAGVNIKLLFGKAACAKDAAYDH